MGQDRRANHGGGASDMRDSVILCIQDDVIIFDSICAWMRRVEEKKKIEQTKRRLTVLFSSVWKGQTKMSIQHSEKSLWRMKRAILITGILYVRTCISASWINSCYSCCSSKHLLIAGSTSLYSMLLLKVIPLDTLVKLHGLGFQLHWHCFKQEEEILHYMTYIIKYMYTDLWPF